MGEYSAAYYLNKFDEFLQLAVKAKDRGDLAKAKEHFYSAAYNLRNAAVFLTGDEKEQAKQRADRIEQIANSIKVSKATPKQNNFSQSGNSSFGGSANKDSYGSTSEEEGDEMEIPSYLTFYNRDQLKFGFEGVIGLKEAKDAITDLVIKPMSDPEAYRYKLSGNRCILLEGVPGTGKTTFAKALAKEINQPFALIATSQLVNAYIGETAKNIDNLFAFLRNYGEQNHTGITIFFDEFDEIAKRRDGEDKTSQIAVPALLRNLDGMVDNKEFLILANTNCKDMLDKGILSRFSKSINIPLPNKEDRIALFKLKMDDVEEEYMNDINFDEVGEKSEGLSGRDITYVVDYFKVFLGDVNKFGLKEGQTLTKKLVELIEKRLIQMDD